MKRKKRKYDYLWHILACSKYSMSFPQMLIFHKERVLGYFVFSLSTMFLQWITMLGFFSVSMPLGGRYINLWEFEFEKHCHLVVKLTVAEISAPATWELCDFPQLDLCELCFLICTITIPCAFWFMLVLYVPLFDYVSSCQDTSRYGAQ